MWGGRTRRRTSGRTVDEHQCAGDSVEGIGGEEASVAFCLASVVPLLTGGVFFIGFLFRVSYPSSAHR